MHKKEIVSRRRLLQGPGVVLGGAAIGSMLSAKEVQAAKKKAARFAMVIDLSKCSGCRACTVACKAEHGVPLGSWNSVVKTIESGTFPKARRDFLPRLCNHCEGTDKVGREKVPPCVKVCPEFPKPGRKKYVTPNGKTIRYSIGATYKRPDGVVLVDNKLCIGCGKCVDACPYGARYLNPFVKAGGDPTKNGVGKCDFCKERIDHGVVPACVNTCEGQARIFGDLNDPNSEVSKLVKKYQLEKNSAKTTMLPKENTLPKVFYIDPEGVLSIYQIDKETKQAEFVDQMI
jgi:tetrathionate reductase subunit B